MRRLLIIFLLTTACIAMQAQPFAITWLHHPTTSQGEQVWFSTVVSLDDTAADAILSVTTTGRVDIYVNERNVATDALIPYRESDELTAITTDFDVARFLRKGDNIIAVWYAPLGTAATDKQIAVVLNGSYEGGEQFVFGSDNGWICRKANRMNTATGEACDATSYTLKWNSDDIDIATWLPAETLKTDDVSEHHTIYDRYIVEKVSRIRIQESFDIDNGTLIYDFGNAFRGWVRATMRGRKRGEKVTIDNLEYICKAQTDEQAFHKFTIGQHRRVAIKSTGQLLPENIFTLEAIEIASEYRTFSFY